MNVSATEGRIPTIVGIVRHDIWDSNARNEIKSRVATVLAI